jgi:hypothetical protein
MFGWFKKKPSGADQLKDFIDRLSQSNSEDLGLAVATVEHFANSGWMYGDFYKPQGLMASRPDVLGMGVLEAQRLQMSGLEVVAVGWIVWVHTFRAIQNPELIPLAKSMWALLIRGAPFAAAQAATLVPILGFELRVEQPDRVPEGFV